MRTWLWHGKWESPMTSLWVAELGEGEYLACSVTGRLRTYESRFTPTQGVEARHWEELSSELA